MRRVGNIQNCKALHSLRLLQHVICCFPEAIDQIHQHGSHGRL
jgi:hypothetical protein